NYNNYQ
nr:Chain A, prion New1p [Saccharomyces cerevisiae]7N2K_A Chain A, prion New1p [Saccharomyces cerevisiae]